MRKTSQDGGDSTSITSGVDNENKKSVFKFKKSSLKRKAPNTSHESDDTVIEPLLQKDKEKPEIIQGANIFMKAKTGSANGKDSDKVKLLNDKVKTTATTGFCGTTESLLSTKDYDVSETTPKVTVPIHNHMNTNVFNSHDNSKANVTSKSQILVEIDASKQSSYNPSPLIFTTAKIHTNGKSKNMEPVQVTPVPILSTIEVSVSKSGNITSNEKKISTNSSVRYAVDAPVPNVKAKEEKVGVTNSSEVLIKDIVGKTFPTTIDSKISNNTSIPNSSFKNHIPSSTSKTSLISNVIDKPVIANDIKKEQCLQKISDTTKNSVSVKTTKTLPGQINMVEISSKQPKSAQTGKLEPTSGNKTESKQVKSKDSEQSAPNIKSPISSKEPVGISSVSSKSVSTSSGSKQLQRQKTATKDTSAFESKEFVPDVQTSKDFSAKTVVSSSKNKVSDSNLSKNSDIMPRPSANNTQTLTKFCSNTTATSTNCKISTPPTKPVITTVSLSIVVTSTAASVTSKPAYTSSLKTTTISSQTTTPTTISATTILPDTSKSTASTKPILLSTVKFPDVNSAKTKVTTKQSTTSTPNDLSKMPSVTTSMEISTMGSAVITATSTKPSSEVTSAQTISTKQPSTSIEQTIASKPSLTTSTQMKTINSMITTDVSLSAKPTTSVQMTAAATKPITSGSKTEVAKIPSVTSTKTSQIDFVSSATLTKPPSEVSSAKQTTTSIGKSDLSKLPSVTTSINTTPIDSVSSTSTKPLSQDSSTKQPITSIGKTVLSKLPMVTTSSKTTPIGSVSSTSTKTSSEVSSTKSSTSVVRPSSVATSTNTSVSSSNTTDASSRSDKPCTEISSAHMTTTKQPTSSIGKNTVAKTTPVITPTKPTPLNITSSTSASKTKPTGVTSAESTAYSNKPTTPVGRNVLEKTPSVKRSTKIPVSSVSSESKSTSIAISSGKPVATTGSVPSYTAALGPPSKVPETKQGQSKSSQYNKDVDISKA